MILYILFFIVFIVLYAYNNFYHEADKGLRKWINPDVANFRWHILDWFIWAIVFECIAYLTFGFTLLALKILLLTGIVFWTLFDGGLNLLRKENFFHISNTTPDLLNSFSQWYVKLVLLIISIGLFYV